MTDVDACRGHDPELPPNLTTRNRAESGEPYRYALNGPSPHARSSHRSTRCRPPPHAAALLSMALKVAHASFEKFQKARLDFACEVLDLADKPYYVDALQAEGALVQLLPLLSDTVGASVAADGGAWRVPTGRCPNRSLSHHAAAAGAVRRSDRRSCGGEARQLHS